MTLSPLADSDNVDSVTISPLHDVDHRSFASDNYAGIHPDVFATLAAANGGHQSPYGADEYTNSLRDVIRGQFGDRAEVYPLFNGTGANVVALSALLPRWGAVIAPASAHINTSEGAAPERLSGIKVIGMSTDDGKLTPSQIEAGADALGDEQLAQPLAVSITQVTELGTLYTAAEIADLSETAHRFGMGVHVDGSRLWNAAAALRQPFREFLTDAGVDIVSLGGTKNGTMAAEAVVVIDPDRAPGVGFLRKSTTQLSSKMRFTSAQLLALFDDDLGLRNAAHANALAARLRAELERGIDDGSLAGLTLTQKTESNTVFARLPVEIADRIRERVHFYDWDRSVGEVRWMTAWDTTTDDVDRFVDAIRWGFATT